MSIGALSALCSPAAHAVRPVVWTESPTALARGQVDSVAFGPTGSITLGPRVEPLSPRPGPVEQTPERTIPDPIIWCAALDGGGNLLLGTGHSGRVLQLDARGEVTILAELIEPEVTALLVSRRGETIVATSPQGAIYRLRKDRSPEVLFEPEERYIWTLAEDDAGNIYAGTGEKGRIYRISTKGEGSLHYDSPEPHITALRALAGGGLIAGSDGTGKIYRIMADKTGTVLHDSNSREISDLAVDGSGNIYASAVSEGAGEIPPPAPRLLVKSPDADGRIPESEELGPMQPDAARDREREPPMQAEIEGLMPGAQTRREREGGGVILRISPSGRTDELWRSSEEVPFALAVAPDGGLFAGTGQPARLLKIEERGRAISLTRFPQDQLTDLAFDGGGRLYAVTSNAGAAYRLTRELADSGTYTSQVRDAGAGARWGRIRWEASAGSGQRVEVQTRSGNSSVPDETWSAWSAVYADPEGSEIISPPGRFIQWKARLVRPVQGSSSPVLRSLSVSYLPANRPPRLRELKLLAWNEVAADEIDEPAPDRPAPEKPPEVVPGRGSSEAVAVTASPVEGGGQASGGNARPQGPSGASTPRRQRERVIVWHGQDPDNDTLVAQVFLQREGEENWTSVCSNILDSTCSFDETRWKEGRYKVKAVVSDASSNYAGEALDAEMISEPALIDHSPPVLERLSPKEGRIIVRAIDLLSPIETAELLAGEHAIATARPTDGVLDSRTEVLEISPPRGPSDPLRLRVRDGSGNEATLSLDKP